MYRYLALVASIALLLTVACGGTEIVTKEVVVEKEVIKEVPIEKIVTQEVVKTVEVEVPGETKIVEVEKVVTDTKIVEVPVVTEKIVEKIVPKVEYREKIVTVVQEVEAPKTYGESPMWAQMVQAGQLPPVAERLPEEPWVIPTDRIGKYGGQLHRAYLGMNDMWNFMRLSRHPVARWTTDGTGAIPSTVKGWEISDGGATYTFTMRKGMKWSDGVPVTMEDIRFAWEDVIANDKLGCDPEICSGMLALEGKLAKFEVLNDWQFRISFLKPNYTYVKAMPQMGFSWLRLILPAHWAKQYHGDYADPTALAALLEENDMDEWDDLFAKHMSGYTIYNIDQPTLSPWQLKGMWGDSRVIAERNPYFFGVDSDGNQLPYIDRIIYDLAGNGEVIQLRAIAGELEVQGRHVKLSSYPVLMENADKGNYDVHLWPEYGGSNVVLWFNQTWEGPEAEYFTDVNFRRAMSLAIDRETINEVSFLGLAKPRNYMPAPGHPQHPGVKYETLWATYEKDKAIEMLDEILPNKNDDGHRLMANGDVLSIEIIMFEGYADWSDATEQVISDWDAVGVKATMRVGSRSNIGQEWNANEAMVYNHPMDTAGFTFATAGPKSAFGGLQAPLWGEWFNTNGESGVKPPDKEIEITEAHDLGAALPPDEANKLAQSIYAYHAEMQYGVSIVGLRPEPFVVSRDIGNFPSKGVVFWPLRSPNNGFPETWFYK